MYFCEECHCRFFTPARFRERHCLPEPPFEELPVCPHCGSDRWKQIE